MTKLSLLVALAAIPACTSGYYVADIRPAAGGIEVTKCAFDSRGKAETGDCTTSIVPVAAVAAPGPAELQMRASRPAPTAADLAAAFNTPSVHALLVQCRDTYAKGAASFAFAVTVEHAGTIATVAPAAGVDPQFADCATRALRSASLAHFDGPPVTVDETLAL